jgi:hypothetical protein
VLSSVAADLPSAVIGFGLTNTRLIISVLSLSSGAGSSPCYNELQTNVTSENSDMRPQGGT